MIETIVKPQALENDIAVMKILQLMGQLSLNDLGYILQLVAKVYLATQKAQKKWKIGKKHIGRAIGLDH